MKFWDLLLPRHRACCDAANDSHTDLVRALRRLDAVTHERDVLDIQLAEQIMLNEQLVRFLSVITPEEL